MKGMMRQRNKPAATLIKQYANKKSGHVSEARREIHRRFEYLDWSQQKKIIMAHLDSCPSDRDWIYPRMLQLWDKDFEPKVKHLWETYHEERCSWLVVRHLPEAYVKEHLDELSTGRNYYFICLRFGEQEGFVVDKTKMAPIDYLTFIYRTYFDISDEEALDCLYRIVLQEFQHPKLSFFHRIMNPEDEFSLSIVGDVNQALFYLRMMKKEKALAEFEQWEKQVCQHAAPKLSQIKRRSLSDVDYDLSVFSALMTSVAELLPDKYKKLRVNELASSSEPMRNLVEQLGLTEVFDSQVVDDALMSDKLLLQPSDGAETAL